MDIVSDFITNIRNSSISGKKCCIFRWSMMLEGIANVLKENGLIKGYEKFEKENNKTFLKIDLKYTNTIPVINEIHTVSTPGCRKYCGIKDIPNILGGIGVVIMSTSRGVMSGFNAIKNGIGGEILCYVW